MLAASKVLRLRGGAPKPSRKRHRDDDDDCDEDDMAEAPTLFTRPAVLPSDVAQAPGSVDP